MTIRLDELASWKLVPKGEALLLPGDTDSIRRVRIHLNCEDRTWVYVASADIDAVEAQFVAAVGPGLETVEFHAGGDLAVKFVPGVPDGQRSQVWLYTAELEPNVSAVPDAVSFTEIHQRRARNPELEMMQLMARQNERRMDEKLARMEALLAERERTNVDPGTPAATPPAASAGASGGEQASSGENPPSGGEQPSGDGNGPET